MKLYIDTTNTESIRVGLDDQVFTADSKVGKSQMVLPFIEELLHKNNKIIGDISEIEVNTGPGSFTGIRVGISVAQTLAWRLKVPLNGLPVGKHSELKINY